MRILIIFILLTIIIWPFNSYADFSDCSDGWIVTGYYVALEADFSGEKEEIVLAEGGTRELKKDFLDTVLIEGSGESESGEIIEWYWSAWHINDKPEDYFGDRLIIGTAATDPEQIPLKDRLTIPSLQAPYNEIVYTASDIGPSIKGKHIDVFMGSGKNALDEAWLFPDFNTVCLEKAGVGAAPGKEKEIVIDLKFSKGLAGQILLQTEENGEAWYVYPDNNKRYYLKRPQDAFFIMRELGLGATNKFIKSYTLYPEHVLGKILIDVDDLGKAYYISPRDRKAYYLGRPADAFKIMGGLGLGISNNDILKIEIGEM